MDVKIRPLEEDDAYTSVNWRNDSEVFKYTGNTYDHIITIESELQWIRRVMSNLNDYRCAISVDGVYVGNIYLTDIHDGEATYHIFIGEKAYWGKGVAKKASELLIDYAKSISLKRIILKVRPQNEAALYLYRSLGFKEINMDEKFIAMGLVL